MDKNNIKKRKVVNRIGKGGEENTEPGGGGPKEETEGVILVGYKKMWCPFSSFLRDTMLQNGTKLMTCR